MSLLWGVGLLTDATLRVACIYLLAPDIAANASQVLMVTAYTLLIGWTIFSAKKTMMISSVVRQDDTAAWERLATNDDWIERIVISRRHP